MQALVRGAGRRFAACASQVRRMSSGVSHEEEVKQMNLWRNVTIAGMSCHLCSCLLAYLDTTFGYDYALGALYQV